MNGNRLQVLFISSWYPNKIRPLLGIFVKRHALAVAELCDVAVIYAYATDSPSIEENIEEDIYTIRVGYRKIANGIPVISQFLKFRAYIKAYKKAALFYKEKKGVPDIVNLNVVFPAGMIATYLKKIWNVPYIVTEHWTGYFPEDGRYKGAVMKYFTRKTIKNASAVVTVSYSLKNRMREVGLKNDYHVISNVVDTRLFNLPETRSKNDNFNFIHVSSLDDDQKNVSGIVRVFAQVYQNEPKARLTIIGEGEAKGKLMELAKSLKLDNCVDLVGQKTGSELTAIFQNADAFILFSNYENLPCVMLETLCCGVPVIGTRVGDIPKYINSSNGILVDSHNEKQLSIAMEELIRKRDKYNPSDIRASVVVKVNSDVIANQFLSVYNKVLNRN
ncbi:MAG TPA: glycosyltransferase [Bacteroidia bacterium]|nr:glycosyltransferase [Bacteroidia bacterium]